MQREALILSSLALTLTLAACSKAPQNPPQPAATPPPKTAAAPPKPATPAPAPAPSPTATPAAKPPVPMAAATPTPAAPGAKPGAPGTPAAPAAPAAQAAPTPLTGKPAPLVAKPGAKPGAPAAPAPTAVDPKSLSQALGSSQKHYEAKGRRDPFDNIETRIKETPQAMSLTGTKLTAIVRGRTTLALVEDAKGVGYILKMGDMLGDGRVVEIGADSVVFAMAPKPGSTTNRVVLRIATD